jgi:calnexin
MLFFLLLRLPMQPAEPPFHYETLGDEDWDLRWQVTSRRNYTGRWRLKHANFPALVDGEQMLFTDTAPAYYGLSILFETPFSLHTRNLVLQFETKFRTTLNCGAAYIKLFHEDNFSPDTLSNETHYLLMFGPDYCGPDHNKVHFILRVKNARTGLFEEKHLIDPPKIENDELAHLYTLILRTNDTFEILIDADSVHNGSLWTDFSPPVWPTKTIDDPTDFKPEDWDDRELIEDWDATQPDDWEENENTILLDEKRKRPPIGWLVDEPPQLPDPSVKKPKDWNDVIHGEWRQKMIPNPKCAPPVPGCGPWKQPYIQGPPRGPWKPPLIPNPNYQGPYPTRQIPNDDYYVDPIPHNFPDIIGAGFELWIVTKDIGIGKVYIGDDEAAVARWNEAHFIPKHEVELGSPKREPEVLKVEDILPKTTSTPWPSPTIRGLQPYDEALSEFWRFVTEAKDQLFAVVPEMMYISTFVVIGLPLAIWRCAVAYRRRRSRLRRQRRKRSPSE